MVVKNYWNGKNKAVTFSYDDGITQDIRLIELLNKYNLKCTFNLNSEFLNQKGILIHNDKKISHYKIHTDDVKCVYEGHEIAVHTLTHPNLTQCDTSEVIHQVETDRLNLSQLVGYEVVGMAYPCGGVPAIALPSITALNSAFGNDGDPELIYAQPLIALANKNDILIGISTSGNSKNVFAAVKVAKALGVKVIGLTGNAGGKLKEHSDIAICVPEIETIKIQELHLPVYHYLCAAVEEYFFEN